MTSKEYWEERMSALESVVTNRCAVSFDEISKIYKGAMRDLKEQIQQIMGTFATVHELTPADADRLLTWAETRERAAHLQQLLEETDDPELQAELRARINAPAYAFRIGTLEALQGAIYFDMMACAPKEIAIGENRLADIYSEAYYSTSYGLSKQAGYNVPFETLTDRRAKMAVREYWSTSPGDQAANYSERVWGNTRELTVKLREIVSRNFLTGGNYQTMMKEIDAAMGGARFQKVVQPDGSATRKLTGSGASYRSARLIRTEGNRITGGAVLDSYKSAGIDRYIYRALLEVRTCEECGELDGKDFPVSEALPGTNYHPMHPNCRCFSIPHQPINEIIGERSAQKDADEWEQVPASMTYKEWKKKFLNQN